MSLTHLPNSIRQPSNRTKGFAGGAEASVSVGSSNASVTANRAASNCDISVSFTMSLLRFRLALDAQKHAHCVDAINRSGRRTVTFLPPTRSGSDSWRCKCGFATRGAAFRGRFTGSSSERERHPLRGCGAVLIAQMPVGSHSERSAVFVSEPTRDGRHINAGFDANCGEEMPHVVMSHAGCADDLRRTI